MCSSKLFGGAKPQAAPVPAAPSPTATAYVSPEADPSSPGSAANAVSRKKLKIDLATPRAPGAGLVIPSA